MVRELPGHSVAPGIDPVLRWLFFALIVKPICLIVLGLNVRRRQLLPTQGPAFLVANHNSHLDVLVMMSLYPLSALPRLRPVAAADYFFLYKPLAWFAHRVIGIIPLEREVKGMRVDPLAGVGDAVRRGDIVILFPEGKRGEPEVLEQFKNGIAHLARRHPDVPITPAFMHGVGKALPRDEALLVPFFCDVFVDEPMKWTGDKATFMDTLNARMKAMSDEGHFEPWT